MLIPGMAWVSGITGMSVVRPPCRGHSPRRSPACSGSGDRVQHRPIAAPNLRHLPRETVTRPSPPPSAAKPPWGPDWAPPKQHPLPLVNREEERTSAPSTSSSRGGHLQPRNPGFCSLGLEAGHLAGYGTSALGGAGALDSHRPRTTTDGPLLASATPCLCRPRHAQATSSCCSSLERPP